MVSAEPNVFIAGGTTSSYLAVNFNAVAVANTISNWIFTPTVSLLNGDIINFYARTVHAPAYADRLQMRIGVGATPTALTGNTGFGGYTTLGLDINPTLTLSGFPNVWTQYSYTVTGLPTTTDCKIGYRYFVTNGGSTGSNSDYIGIDSFSVDRTLSTNEFFKNNFAVYPNPATNVVNITKNSNVEMTSVSITDINGRVVKEVFNGLTIINISELNTGVYFLKIVTNEGTGTTKVI